MILYIVKYLLVPLHTLFKQRLGSMARCFVTFFTSFTYVDYNTFSQSTHTNIYAPKVICKKFERVYITSWLCLSKLSRREHSAQDKRCERNDFQSRLSDFRPDFRAIPDKINPPSKSRCDTKSNSELHACAGCWFQDISMPPKIKSFKVNE